MVLTGSQVVILTVEDAEKIYSELVRDRDRQRYLAQERAGVISVLEELRKVLGKGE